MAAFHQDIRFTRSADGTRIAYAAHGEGFPVVQAAHWLTHIGEDWKTPVWRPWYDALGARYRLHRYDARGCGLSDRDSIDSSLDVLVADLEAVVDAAKLERFALFGTSQGGALSIAYAARHPERVSHIVLLGAFARGPLRRNPTPAQLASLEAELKMIEVGWGQDNPAYRQLFTNLLFPNATAEQVASFNDLQRMSCSPLQAARIVRSFSDIDASEFLARVSCPTLVLHTRGDMCAPFDEGLFLASSIPGARLVPLETRSHVPMPGEPSFDRVIEEFQRFVRPGLQQTEAFPDLTRRERQILAHIARGLDNLQIAAHLDLSEKTVRNHITAVFAKIGVESRAQAIVQAREAGLVDEPRR
jgi:pimeloyl-ACP methyl ester carboxylesterase/DNA-binding CsgD family transcriptional regulator